VDCFATLEHGYEFRNLARPRLGFFDVADSVPRGVTPFIIADLVPACVADAVPGDLHLAAGGAPELNPINSGPGFGYRQPALSAVGNAGRQHLQGLVKTLLGLL
jgi:hypothetical protein